MKKDIIISLLAAAVIIRHPWIACCRPDQLAAMYLSLSGVLLFFCFFCEEKYEKWMDRKERVRKMHQKIKKIGEIRIWDSNRRMRS